MMTCTVRLSEITTHCCRRQLVASDTRYRCATRQFTHNRGLAVELGVAQDGGRGVVENVQELCRASAPL